MSLKLIKGSYQYKEPIITMLKEWKEYNDTHDVNCSPWAIFKNSYDDFDFYLSNLETSEPKDGWVPLTDLNLGSDAELLEDYRGRSLLVFSSFWAIDFTCRRNPGLKVSEIVVAEG